MFPIWFSVNCLFWSFQLISISIWQDKVLMISICFSTNLFIFSQLFIPKVPTFSIFLWQDFVYFEGFNIFISLSTIVYFEGFNVFNFSLTRLCLASMSRTNFSKLSRIVSSKLEFESGLLRPSPDKKVVGRIPTR